MIIHVISPFVYCVYTLIFIITIKFTRNTQGNQMSKQLIMVWPKGQKIESSKKYFLPAEYEIRNFQDGDDAGYIQLMNSAGFDWKQSNLDSALLKAIPEGIFFVIHKESKEIIATAMGCISPSGYFSENAELGWVACNQKHAGKGLGYLICEAVVQRFHILKYNYIYLKTDDFRLPAIKTYLSMGFLPFHYTDDSQERWNKVMKDLQLNEKDYTGKLPEEVS